jgi:DNA-binding CsgD family transcriptional regulator
MPRPTWQGSEFFVDFIKPQKVSHLLVMRFKDEGEMVAHLGIFRPPTSPGFSSRDLFKAQYLSSLFSQNFRYQKIAQRSRELEKLLGQVNAIPSSGAVILDLNLKMLYCNPSALEFGITPQYAPYARSLAEGYDTVLPREILEECRNIRCFMGNNPWSRPDNRHMVLWGENFQRVDVDIIVLPVEPHNNRCSSYFLILLNKVHHTTAANGGMLPQNAGLTQKETEIARCICQGMTNKEIGNALFISLPTVATHVQHIFKKMGIRRRNELIRGRLQ